MGGIFSYLINEDLIDDWAKTLDWLLNDNRFSSENGWDKNKVTRFTNKVKRDLKFSDKNFIMKSSKKNNLEQITTNWKAIKNPVVNMLTDSSQGRALVRHIRNGIAHGRAEIRSVKSEPYIEIIDINKEGRSAYILIPVSYIPKMYRIYSEVEKATRNDKSTKRAKNEKTT